jgi:putative acetyltransferase
VVRDYAARDLGAVVAVFRRSVHEIASRDYDPDQLEAWAPESADPPAWSARLTGGGAFVCLRDGRVVGFGRIDERGVVDLLYVDSDAQRTGVGRELMARMFSWAAGRRLRRLHAEVSLTARPFFERMGFRVLRRQVVERQGERLENYVMECSR